MSKIRRKLIDRKVSMFIREWLNDSEGSAYVMVEMDNESPETGIFIDLEIKDCTRQLSLDFYYDTPERYRDRLVKLNRLYSALDAIKMFMMANPPENKS